MISNRCARKSLVTNCNSIISKNYLRFLVDSNGLLLFRRESYICRYQRPQVTCPGFSTKQAGRPTGSSDLLSGKQAIYSFCRFHQKYPEPLQRESCHPHRAFSPGSRLHQPGQGSFAQTLAEQIIKKDTETIFRFTSSVSVSFP